MAACAEDPLVPAIVVSTAQIRNPQRPHQSSGSSSSGTTVVFSTLFDMAEVWVTRNVGEMRQASAEDRTILSRRCSLCNEPTMATPTGDSANFSGKKLNVLVYSGSLSLFGLAYQPFSDQQLLVQEMEPLLSQSVTASTPSAACSLTTMPSSR